MRFFAWSSAIMASGMGVLPRERPVSMRLLGGSRLSCGRKLWLLVRVARCRLREELELICDCHMFAFAGDATVGKTALTAMFFSGGNAYPKNYVMVRRAYYPAACSRITCSWLPC